MLAKNMCILTQEESCVNLNSATWAMASFLLGLEDIGKLTRIALCLHYFGTDPLPNPTPE